MANLQGMPQEIFEVILGYMAKTEQWIFFFTYIESIF